MFLDCLLSSVAGAAVPNPPLLGTVDVFPTKAVINFVVTFVSYDPEEYTVLLGTSDDQLLTVSGVSESTDPTGLTFLTDVNLMYSITVENLNSTQEYYYQIVAMNSVDSTVSVTGTFTTAEAGKMLAAFHVILYSNC